MPNELKTVEQYRQIIDAFIAKHLQDHYYAYAIHNKIGMLSEDQHHPHVHIMFSERLIDDVEKKRERAANAFFIYLARKKKDGSQPSFEEAGLPKTGSCAVINTLAKCGQTSLKSKMKYWSRNGFSIRVDHRTLKTQKEEAHTT